MSTKCGRLPADEFYEMMVRQPNSVRRKQTLYTGCVDAIRFLASTVSL